MRVAEGAPRAREQAAVVVDFPSRPRARTRFLNTLFRVMLLGFPSPLAEDLLLDALRGNGNGGRVQVIAGMRRQGETESEGNEDNAGVSHGLFLLLS